MIDVALLWIAVQLPSDPAAAAAHEIAWRAAGIARVARAENAVADEQHLRVRGFADAAWRTSDPSLAFARIPGTEPYFGTADPAAAYVAWRDQLAPLLWDVEEPALRLAQVGDTGIARGELHLRPPETTGDAARATRVSQIDRFRAGCAMEHDFESPVELGAGGVELGFAWDLHSPIQIERLRLTPECAGVTLPTIALELAVPVPALRIEPAQLAFADGRGARAAVSVLPRRGARAQLVHVAHPECVGLTRIEERDDGGWSIELEALALAATLHECHGVRVDVRVGDDPQPFSRFVRVEHGSRVTEPDGAQVLGGVFLPGEQVELFGDGRRVTWCLPDRVPCARGLLESFGFQRIARFQAPSEPGAVDARVAAGGSSFRVVGAATDVAFAHADAWVAACKR